VGLYGKMWISRGYHLWIDSTCQNHFSKDKLTYDKIVRRTWALLFTQERFLVRFTS